MLLLLVYTLLLSLLLFCLYGWDKFQAQHGGWRTPESRLQWLALLGGWPGALLAQQLFRHKRSKTTFMRRFWWLVALNCAVQAGLLVYGHSELNMLQGALRSLIP